MNVLPLIALGAVVLYAAFLTVRDLVAYLRITRNGVVAAGRVASVVKKYKRILVTFEYNLYGKGQRAAQLLGPHLGYEQGDDVQVLADIHGALILPTAELHRIQRQVFALLIVVVSVVAPLIQRHPWSTL